MQLQLLERFEQLFRGTVYNHRVSTNGDLVSLELFEDLLSLDRSDLLSRRISDQTHVVNTLNRTLGRIARRGDGTFGELVPTESPKVVAGYKVARGPTATLEIGAECKVICVAQNRQVDRVCNDLKSQVEAFKSVNRNAVCIAIVGVNRAGVYRSIEGAKKPRSEWRITRTTGSGSYLHPAQEAATTIATLNARVASLFDEFLLFEFLATNDDPFDFSWHNEQAVRQSYSSALTRIARNYAQRFPA